MNQELSFETIPFEIAPEFQGEVFEEEGERGVRRPSAGGGSRYSRSRSQPGLRPKGTKRPPVSKPRPIPRGPRRPWEVIREPYGLVSAPYPGEPEPSGSERVRWIQDCLNQALGLQLPVTGVMGAETRSAVRSFQKQQGLRVSGIVSPKTEQALSSACEGGQASRAPSEEMEGFWEVLASNGESEQEFVVQKSCVISYQRSRRDIDAVSVDSKGILVANPSLPKEQGVYVIKIGKVPYYVGVAANKNGVKARFDDRVKAVRDFGISIETINRKVDVYTLAKGVEGTCSVNRRKEGTKVPGLPVRNHAELLLLEQYLISKLNTRGKGNIYSEKMSGATVTFKGTLGWE
jgi:hypothetical protein